MLAIIALVCFILALFIKAVGEFDLVTLGLVFVAAHLVFSSYIPWPRPRS